ncbi:MAG: DUF1501 domain-containing protein [Verrucomicrobia bacterium]|nr:DUF1501 domain-containing protein [Verrucomicrobiota bacterium]
MQITQPVQLASNARTVPGFGSRRAFLGACGTALFNAAVVPLLAGSPTAGDSAGRVAISPSRLGLPHFVPRAKNVIFLFMIGAPSQLDLFDHKPLLNQREGEPLPDSLLRRAKFAQIKEKQPKLWGTRWAFAQHGQCGAQVSELLPHTASIVDQIAFLKTVKADDVNHSFGELQMNTGWRQFGRPSLGSWVAYGLGTESKDLPGFVVLRSGMHPRSKGANYGSAFLPSAFQGVPLREKGDAILNLGIPDGLGFSGQGRTVAAINRLNQIRHEETGDPEILARISAYELAFRMQASAPGLLDLRGESPSTFSAYGCDPVKPSFARNCLLARRLIERGVRFVQLFHGDWDHHSNIEQGLPSMCRSVDQASAALVKDLAHRGLLDDTLVIWGGEFGRGAVAQVESNKHVGRDHHIDAFTLWMAGGGVRPGFTLGETDEFGYLPLRNSVHIHDLHATILHLLGLDHERLTFRFAGRDFRLTDVAGDVVTPLLL